MNSEKNYAAALTEFQTALKVDSTYMAACYHIGRTAALADSSLAQGEESLKKYLGYTPKDNEPTLARAHYYLGAISYSKGDAKSAEAEYREADRIDPRDPRPLTSLCQMQAALKKDDVESTRKLIAQRFGDQSKALLVQCAP